VILLLACGASPSEPLLCLPQECVVFEAREAARDGESEQAFELCSTLNGAWEDECWFLAADTLDLTGPEAFEACRMARRYERQCLGHALTRQAEALFDEGATEAEALRVLTEGFARHYPTPRARSEAQRLVEAEVARRE